MVKAKIILDGRHVASAHLKDSALHLSVNNLGKIFTSPRFVKLALSLKAAAGKPGEKGLDIKFDAGIVKSIFSR